ncbi:phosphatase PAP2 family protein [Methanosphaera sp. WGK6]|uniref:phosphatase PAP2 family protein n=1 Tax=Methanosphaera sp. WGK6 TaxID=1561964 RepID=UPI00084CA482|nr:phosphatase PAP2 family protein [Methanosphaera sp. WGK6]
MFSILYSWDIKLLELVNLSFHNFFLNNLALIITYFGVLDTGLFIALILYLFGNEKEKRVAKILVVTLLLTFVFTQIIKYIILRPRPYQDLSSLIVLSRGTDPSFPSGHTAMASALAFTLGRNYGYLGFFMILPILVALSRLYLGVHYPSDVFVGFLLGIIVSYLCEYLFKNTKIMNFIKNSRKTLKV